MNRRTFLASAAAVMVTPNIATAGCHRRDLRIKVYGNSLCQIAGHCWPWHLPNRYRVDAGAMLGSDNLMQIGYSAVLPVSSASVGQHDREFTDLVVFHGFDLYSAVALHTPVTAAENYMALVTNSRGTAPSCVVLSHRPMVGMEYPPGKPITQDAYRAWREIVDRCAYLFDKHDIPVFESDHHVVDSDFIDGVHLSLDANQHLASRLHPWLRSLT